MLNQHQIALIQSTIPVLEQNGVALTSHFYKRMLSHHPELKEVFNLGHQRSGAQAKSLAAAVLAYARNIENPQVLASATDLIAHKHVSLDIQAPDYAIVGENLLHSISEVLGITMQDPLIVAWEAAYHQLASLLINKEQTLYSQNQSIPGGWSGWRPFIVDKKIKETDEVTSFYLIPQDGKSLPAYQAGQYITLRVYVPELGIKQPRQYSLSDAYSSSGYFRITVRHEKCSQDTHGDGYVSSVLHDVIGEKDIVELTTPTGNFFLKDMEKTNVLISGGTGITPMIAMLKQLLSANHGHPVHFIHAARSSGLHILREEIQTLANQYPNLRLLTVYEKIDDQDKDYHAQGYLDLAQLDKGWLPEEADFYLCGPLAFMQQQNKALIDIGIKQQNIYSEAFNTGGVPL